MAAGGPWCALELVHVLSVMLQTSGSPWWHLLLIFGGEEVNWVGLGEVMGMVLSPGKGGGMQVVVLQEVTGLSV